MSSRLLKHIRQLINVHPGDKPLYGEQMAVLPLVENAWLLMEGNEIAGFGPMADLERVLPNLPDEIINCQDRLVLPAWCDSHTHLVFAGSREHEFVDKIGGMDYAQINQRGGGILHTVRQIEEIAEDELFRISWKRLEEIAKLGTGAVEIKSGYGLTVESELKMLRVIRRLREKSRLQVRATFLGAHTYPVHYRDNHAAYIEEIVHQMLPVIARDNLADYIDVFCEKGFFSPEEMQTICLAGQQYGLQAKLHVNQLNSIGGFAGGMKLNALSLDHLETLSSTDIDLLKNADWKGLCTLLPTAAFFLRMQYPPARVLLEAGAALALASDYNPGSSPSGNMNFVIALACIQMKLFPEEALNAATVNGAYAMGLGHRLGSIAKGKLANLIITQPVPSLAYLPYCFGSNSIDKVILGGEIVA